MGKDFEGVGKPPYWDELTRVGKDIWEEHHGEDEGAAYGLDEVSSKELFLNLAKRTDGVGPKKANDMWERLRDANISGYYWDSPALADIKLARESLIEGIRYEREGEYEYATKFLRRALDAMYLGQFGDGNRQTVYDWVDKSDGGELLVRRGEVALQILRDRHSDD